MDINSSINVSALATAISQTMRDTLSAYRIEDVLRIVQTIGYDERVAFAKSILAIREQYIMVTGLDFATVIEAELIKILTPRPTLIEPTIVNGQNMQDADAY